MKLTNDFSVAAPIDRTWETLLDLQRVASCLPGAKMSPAGPDGTYRGEMKVKFGAVTSEYTGVAEVREVDEDSHVAVFDVTGKEKRGQGTASATITNRLDEGPDGTRVTVETDLNITGRPAQFGRGIMDDVASLMLTEFAKRLERLMLAPDTQAVSAGTPEAASSGVPDGPVADATAGSSGHLVDDADDDVLDIGAVAWKPVVKRLAPVAAGVAGVASLLAVVVGRRRRGITLRIDL